MIHDGSVTNGRIIGEYLYAYVLCIISTRIPIYHVYMSSEIIWRGYNTNSRPFSIIYETQAIPHPNNKTQSGSAPELHIHVTRSRAHFDRFQRPNQATLAVHHVSPNFQLFAYYSLKAAAFLHNHHHHHHLQSILLVSVFRLHSLNSIYWNLYIKMNWNVVWFGPCLT